MTLINTNNPLTAAAVSLVVQGTSGITPFLTLFLLGVLERIDPNILNMDEATEKVVASWAALTVLGLLTSLEFLGKLIPIVDEAMDAAMTFLVPILSVVANLSTWGLYDVVAEAAAEDYGSSADEGDGMNRQLSAASKALWTLKVTIMVMGVCLTLGIHLLKMVIRLVGEGWMTQILTIMETTFTIVCIVVVVFVQVIDILVGFGMMVVVFFFLKRRLFDRREHDEIVGEMSLGRIQSLRRQQVDAPSSPSSSPSPWLGNDDKTKEVSSVPAAVPEIPMSSSGAVSPATGAPLQTV